MKTLKIAIAAVVTLFTFSAANAQVRVSANINVGHPVAQRRVVLHRPPVVHRTVVVRRPAYRPAPRRVVVYNTHPRKMIVRRHGHHVVYRHR